MAERPTPRRKVTGQMAIGASTTPSHNATTSSSPATAAPRLKARVNPSGIISSPNGGTDNTPPPRPALGRTPSNFSLRSDATVTTRTNSSPAVPSSSRSAIGVGTRPPVARAQSMRVGSTSVPPKASSVVGFSSTPLCSTSARTRPASVVGGPSAATPPARSPPIGTGSFNASSGSRFRAAAAGATANDDTTPTRVHVRSNSMQHGDSWQRSTRPPSFTSESRPNIPSHTSTPSEATTRRPSSAAASEAPPRMARAPSVSGSTTTLSRKASRDSGISVASRRGSADPLRVSRQPTAEEAPIATRLAAATAVAGSTSPRIPGDTSNVTSRRGSHLAQVTPSSINLTVQHPAPSSSLLSPSTLIPQPLPPHQGVDSAIHESPEPDVGSNHTSPVRQPRPLGSHSPVLHHRPQFDHVFGPHATASAPTSPVPRGLALDYAERKTRRPTLPWNPNSTVSAPSLPAAPSSPELRTVALPLMTPTRSCDGSDSSPSLGGLGFETRRMSTSSESSGRSTPAKPDFSGTGASRGRLSGSTIADDSDDKLEAVVSSDVERAERAKVERKIADLEISNSSLLAINRSLEATKVKQRLEIMRLRRALRENRAGLGPTCSPGAALALTRSLSIEEEDEESMVEEDPELEARWDRLADLVGAMRRRGDDAIVHEAEVPRAGVQRVLGWLEVEGMDRSPLESNAVSSAASDAGVDITPPETQSLQ